MQHLNRRHRQIAIVVLIATIAGLLITRPFAAERNRPSFSSAPQEDLSALFEVDTPADDPVRGLNYAGLQGALFCPGGYAVEGLPGCTHGPDPAPPGVDATYQMSAQETLDKALVASAANTEMLNASGGVLAATQFVEGSGLSVPTEVAAAEQSRQQAQVSVASLNPDASTGVASAFPCFGDGTSGPRWQVVYVHAAGRANRLNEVRPAILQILQNTDAMFYNSARKTGGERRLKFVHDAACTPRVVSLSFDYETLQDFGKTNVAFSKTQYANLGYKTVMFADVEAYCGIANFTVDSQPGPQNGNARFGSVSRVDRGCWDDMATAHEMMHSLGSVMNNTPRWTRGYHCNTDWDRMCGDDGTGVTMTRACPGDERVLERLFDCNNDDYFAVNPPAGTPVATGWNTANSPYLIGGRQPSDPPAKPTPKTLPNPTGVRCGRTTTAASCSWNQVVGADMYFAYATSPSEKPAANNRSWYGKELSAVIPLPLGAVAQNVHVAACHMATQACSAWSTVQLAAVQSTTTTQPPTTTRPTTTQPPTTTRPTTTVPGSGPGLAYQSKVEFGTRHSLFGSQFGGLGQPRVNGAGARSTTFQFEMAGNAMLNIQVMVIRPGAQPQEVSFKQVRPGSQTITTPFAAPLPAGSVIEYRLGFVFPNDPWGLFSPSAAVLGTISGNQ